MERYPLQWPTGYKKTPGHLIKKSRFVTTLARSRDFVKQEIERLHAQELIISTNLPVNSNGELRADFQRYKVSDYGVAIYFNRKEETLSLCCDQYTTVHDNLYAIGRTLQALRQIDRDGVSDFLNRSFQGFAALPEPESNNIWDVLGLGSKPTTASLVTIAYRSKAKLLHPDAPGGSKEAFQELQEAYEKALKQFQL